MSKIESINKKDDDVIVKFVNSYEFEGETITELDFSGMDDITAKDMIQAKTAPESSDAAAMIKNSVTVTEAE